MRPQIFALSPYLFPHYPRKNLWMVSQAVLRNFYLLYFPFLGNAEVLPRRLGGSGILDVSEDPFRTRVNRRNENMGIALL